MMKIEIDVGWGGRMKRRSGSFDVEWGGSFDGFRGRRAVPRDENRTPVLPVMSEPEEKTLR